MTHPSSQPCSLGHSFPKGGPGPHVPRLGGRQLPPFYGRSSVTPMFLMLQLLSCAVLSGVTWFADLKVCVQYTGYEAPTSKSECAPVITRVSRRSPKPRMMTSTTITVWTSISTVSTAALRIYHLVYPHGTRRGTGTIIRKIDNSLRSPVSVSSVTKLVFQHLLSEFEHLLAGHQYLQA
jgi:hypothetical protein